MSCEYCNDFDCERPLMNDHKQYCHLKPIQCKYCELVIPVDQFDKHSTFCGSKTKECEECGMQVINKEYLSHVSTGQCEIELALRREREQKKLDMDLERFR